MAEEQMDMALDDIIKAKPSMVRDLRRFCRKDSKTE